MNPVSSSPEYFFPHNLLIKLTASQPCQNLGSLRRGYSGKQSKLTG